MSDVPWVCGACRSINQPREPRCYHCRTPRDLGEVDPEQLITAGAGSRPEPIVRPVGTYRNSANRAFLTQALIVAALAVTVVASFLGADLVGRVLDPEAFDEGSAVLIGSLGLLGLGLAALALGAWAAWLSRVVDNIPKLGLGWPNVTPTAAVYESIFPGVNLYRVPAILRDAVNRLEPGGRGEALIAASWLALVGGSIVPRVLRLGSSLVIGDVAELSRAWVVVNQLGLGLTVAGGALLIVLIQWIETRMAARASAQPPPSAAIAAPAATEPTRVQSIAEAAGTALARPQRDPGEPAEPSISPPPAEPSRPRWGGVVATPSRLDPTPQAPPEQPEAPPRYGALDDLPLGEDDR